MLRLIISVSLLLSSCAANTKFVVTAPNIFRSNVEEIVLVSVFGTGDNIPMKVKLTTSEGSELASKDVVVQAGQPQRVSFIVDAADLPADEEIPTVNLRAFSTNAAHPFDRNVDVLVTTKNQVVFIQTDKPIYTPNQEVKIRVISLNEELKPTERKVRLDVITPKGAIIDRREDLTTDTGYITEIFPFSSYPTFGIWSVVVYYGLNYNWNSTVQFELREYVLPTFEVTIDAPNQILPSDNLITAVVKARYVYKKNVKGTAQVRMSVVKNGETIGEFPAQAEELNLEGKATFTVRPDETIDGNWFSKFKGARLRIEAVVTERATGDRENMTVTSTKFVEQVYTFKRDRTVSHFKKGTTFDIKIDVFHSDGTPGNNVLTKVDAYGINDQGVRRKLTGAQDFSLERSSNEYGQVDFRVDVNQDTKSIEVTIETLDAAFPKEANGHYEFTISAIESPSGAYLQIRVPHGEIPVRQNFEVEIVKSGLAELTGLNYVVVVRGKIVQEMSEIDSKLGTLRTIRIHITSDMVPSARLIVYSFANDNNVIVADSILLDIVKQCESQLIVNPDDSDKSPGENVEFTIVAEPRSRVALLAVDEAVYFLKDFHRLTRKKMFQRMESLDLGCGPGGGENSREVFEMAGMVAMTNANFDRTNSREGYGCPMLSERRRKRALNGNQQTCFDEFKSNTTLCSACEDGFLNIPGKTCEQRIKKFAKRKRIVIPDEIGSPPVLTNLDPVIVVFYNCCLVKQAERDFIIGRSAGNDVDIEEDENLVNVRSNFPETWIFDEYTIINREKKVVYSVPDSITNWIVQASSVSSTMGMCVADTGNIRVTKDVFLQLKMPYSIIRGEQTQVQATLFNYGGRETTAHVYMYGREGVCSESLPGKRSEKHELTVPQNDAKTTTFNIIPLDVGTYEIEIKAFSSISNDGIKKNILVVAEGVERYHSTNILIDPTGARDSAAEDGDAQEDDVPLDNEFPFKPETSSEQVMLLSNYEFVLHHHKAKNILKMAEGVERYHSTNILIDPTGARDSAAEDGDAQEDDVPLDNEFPFKPETFKDRANKLQTDTIDIRVSDLNAIAGTEQCYVTFFGDIMTPTVSSVINGLNPGSLIGKPMGCGEQTMMYMSANVYTMLYLSKTNQITNDIEVNGFENVKRSYERMITFQRGDGAFAAWTSRPGSTWLTAYTIKVFYNVLELGKYVDKDKLCAAFRYLQTRYRDTDVGQGLFFEGNAVVHRDMTGGISGDMMMTAFVVITLKEYNPTNLRQAARKDCGVDYTDKITKAIAYLEANIDNLKTPYHLSVVAYALHVAGSASKDDIWMKLKNKASFDANKGLRHWKMNSKALTVEATSYALLTAVYRNEIVYANGIVNWLTEHRDFKRGFSTTSDTAIAFESIATYSSEIDTSSVDMRCKLSSTSSKDYEQIVDINDATSTLSQRKTLKWKQSIYSERFDPYQRSLSTDR
ncbi:complement C3-like [Anneissia japonica]|uniref:complement C3-like n=1 Tax=Anneissia japonica TaxID=1529436 RepID=UPI0014257A8C|nr:complement C3-like [Anneissia japonica]